MPPRLPTAPDPAALAALQAETEKALRATLDELKARAVTLGLDAPPQAVADALREAGALGTGSSTTCAWAASPVVRAGVAARK